MSAAKLSMRGERIVNALNQFDADLAAGTPIKTKYTVRQVRVIAKPSLYPPARVRAVRELIGVSQDVFAQLLAVSPMTIRSWEQGLRQPSPIARRFLDEIRMAPGHFRGRILTAAADGGETNRATIWRASERPFASRSLNSKDPADARKDSQASEAKHRRDRPKPLQQP